MVDCPFSTRMPILNKTQAALAAAAAAVTLSSMPTVQAHHRTADTWERRYAHHHGAWIYAKDKRVTQHRRWHSWHASRDGSTTTRHSSEAVLRVESTAYCLTGYMANGTKAHTGAAAMNGVPLGTKFLIRTGPLKGETLTVKDRIGSGSEFDIAMPNNCRKARKYGRRVINIKRP